MINTRENNGYLPLGSVVSLTGGKKRLSIIGRIQISSETKEQFDYAGVLFPEGYQQADKLYLFNNSDQHFLVDKKN